jgi:hypothetical protein
MSLRTLSEAIILQSAEDLLSASHRKEGLEFFSGEGYRLSAEMAGMTHDEKIGLLHMLMGCIASGEKMRGCSGEHDAGNRTRSGKLTPSHRSRRSAQLSAM